MVTSVVSFFPHTGPSLLVGRLGRPSLLYRCNDRYVCNSTNAFDLFHVCQALSILCFLSCDVFASRTCHSGGDPDRSRRAPGRYHGQGAQQGQQHQAPGSYHPPVRAVGEGEGVEKQASRPFMALVSHPAMVGGSDDVTLIRRPPQAALRVHRIVEMIDGPIETQNDRPTPPPPPLFSLGITSVILYLIHAFIQTSPPPPPSNLAVLIFFWRVSCNPRRFWTGRVAG